MSENSTPQPLTPFLKETSSLYQDIPAGWPSTQEEDTMDRMLKENGLPMTPVLQDDSFSSPKSLEDGSYLNEIFERKSPLGLSNKRQFRRPAQSKCNARSSRTSAAFQTIEGTSDSDLSTNSTVSNPRPKSFYVKTRSKSVAINATLGDEGMSESASDSSVSSAACPSNEIETFGLRHSSKTRSKSFHPKTGGKAFPINATLGDEELSDSSLTQSSAVKTETQPKASFHPKKETNAKQYECSIGEESMSDITITPSSTDKIKAQPKPSFHPMKKTNTQQYECSLGEESMSDVTITPSSSDRSKKRPESFFHPRKKTNTQQYECSLGEEDVSLGEGETVLSAVSPTAEEKREKRVSPRRNRKRKSTSPVQEPSIENSFSSYPSQSLPQKSGTPNSSKKKRTEKMKKQSSVQQNISNMHASEALSPKTVDNSETRSKSSAHPKRRSNPQQHNCSLGEEGMSDVSFAQLSLDCSTRHAVLSFHPKKKTKALQVECTLGDETNDETDGSINELSISERSTRSSQKNVSVNSSRFSSRKSPVITVASDKSPKDRNSFCDESSAVTMRESAIRSNTDCTFIKNNSNFGEQIKNSENLSKQSSQMDVKINSPRFSSRKSPVVTVVNDKIPQIENSFHDELLADSVTEVAVNTSAKSNFTQSSLDCSTRHAVSSFHPKKKTKALQVECTLGDETNDETDGSINELSISERSTRSSQKNVSVNSSRFSSRKSPVITVASDKSPKDRNSFCDESSAVTMRESAIRSNTDCTFIKNNSNFGEQIKNSENLSKQSSQMDVKINSPRFSSRKSPVVTVVNDKIPQIENSFHDELSADSVTEVAANTSAKSNFTQSSLDCSTRHAVSSFHPKKKTKALQVECTLGDETNDETDGSINELSISERSTRSSQKNVSVNSSRFSSRKSPVITVASDKSPKDRNSFCDESSAVTMRESAIRSNTDCTFIKNNSNFEEQIQNSKNLSKLSSQKDVNSPRSSPRNSAVITVVNDQIPENDNSIHDVISADSVAEVAVNTNTNRTFTKANNSISRNQPVKNHGTSLEYETSLDYTAATPYKGEESEDECSIFDNSITYVASGLKAAASFNISLINGSLSSYSVSKLNRQTCPNESFVEEKRTSHLNSSGKTKKRVSNCTSHRTDCGTEAEDYSTLADFSMFASNDMEDASYESHSDVSKRDMQSVQEEPMRLHITEDALACSSNSLAPEISIKNGSLSDRSIILSGNVSDNSKKLRRNLRSSKNLSRSDQGPSVANESGLSEEASMKKSESRNVSSSAGFLTGDGDIEDSAGTVHDSTQWNNNGSKCSHPAPSLNETNDGHISLHNELDGSAYSDVSHNSEKHSKNEHVSLHDESDESANSANFSSLNATPGPQHGPSRISIGTNMNEFFAKPLHPVNKRLERFSSTSLSKSNDSISLLSKCMQKQKKISPKNNRASCGRTLRDRDDGFPKYAAPKLARPAYWVTNRLYSFLEEKLYSEHGIYSKKVAEKFIQFLQEKCKKLMKTSDTELEDEIISEIQDVMVKLRITNSDFMFHYFCQEFLPDEIGNKIVPSLLPYSETCSRPNYDFANLFTKFF